MEAPRSNTVVISISISNVSWINARWTEDVGMDGDVNNAVFECLEYF